MMEFVVLIFIVLLGVYFLLRKCDKVETFVYPGKNVGISVLLLGGTHGNEPAGTVALKRLSEDLKSNKIKVKSGKIIILPEANKCGLNIGMRFQPQHLVTMGLTGNIDLNRGYDLENAGCNVAREIGSLASGCDWVIDLHEGYDYHALNPESMGSGVYYGDTSDSKSIATTLTNNLNNTIKDNNKQFVCKKWPNSDGSLRQLCDKIGVNYILIETTGQENIQPLEVRAEQHYFLLKKFLTLINLI
jgi:predicted deacylase